MSNELGPYSIWMTAKLLESKTGCWLYIGEKPMMVFTALLP